MLSLCPAGKFDHHILDIISPNSIWAFIYVWCMDKILCFMYFCSPPPSVLPGGHKGQLSRFRTITGRKVDRFWWNFMGCIPWSGPIVPIVLLLDTKRYVPLAEFANFFDFCLILRYIIWPIDMRLLIIKLYGQYSAFHVICSLPHPVVHPGDQKYHFLYAAGVGRILSSSSPSVRPYVCPYIYSCERNS